MKHIKFFLFAVLAVALFIGCSSDTKSLKSTPSSLDFGQVNLGDKTTLDVLLKNKYGKDITISTAVITGSTDFTLISGISTPQVMIKNSEITITIQYDATIAGVNEGTLTLTHDGATKPKEIKIEGEGIPVPKISVPVTNNDFGKVLISTSRTFDFDIQNTGTADLTISNFNLVGSGFSISNGGTTPINVIPGAIHTITVKFEPVTAMNYQTEISIVSDAVNETTPVKINVLGEGVISTQELTLNRTDPWDFGTVMSNNPSILDLKLENTGGDPLNINNISLQTGTDFAISSIEDSNGNPLNLPQIVQPGAYIVAMIKFEPTATSLLSDVLTIVHDGINVGSPLDLNLKGDGVLILEKIFSYTGAAQSWTVPAGVTTVTIECWGAEGATGDGVGGKGGYAKGELSVNPGDTLVIYVGGKTGWNGGGAASLGGGTSGGPSAPGANGGGASDVRKIGTTLIDRVIVAGGGGGGGGDGAGSVYGPGGNGGNGGGLTGNDGITGNGGKQGLGGTQVAGGTGGTGNSNCSVTGQSGVSGSLGLGGDGGDGVQGCGGYTGGGGGGGGGGYYGGGGGGGAAAGGGGAWAGGGGGGGSSYVGGVSSSSTTAGVQSGDGQVKISW